MTDPAAPGDRACRDILGKVEVGPRTVLAWTLALTLAAWVELGLTSQRSGVLLISWKWQAALALGGLLVLAEAVLLVAAGRPSIAGPARWAKAREDALLKRKALCAILLALLLPVLPLAVFGPVGRYLVGVFPRLLLFWIVVAASAFLLRAWWTETAWAKLLLGSAIAYAILYRLLAFVPDISAYPFSLGWSEASRYYYASLFFAGRIYGTNASLPELHPTRYFLQSLPFLISGLPIWVHRLWQVALWWAMPAAVAAVLLRRLGPTGRWFRLAVGGWIVLFLFQGPVYYHLLVMVGIVLVGVDVRRPWAASVAVLIASAWAGVSRLNWFPVPGLLAACLYVLAGPDRTKDRPASFRWPLAWVFGGTLVAFATEAAYVRASGLPPDHFTSSLSSQLLFYRLLPNATYSMGILPAILLASAPAAIALWRSRSGWGKGLRAARLMFLGGSMAALFAGGLLVSLKIGGGSNLHNLDAYLVLLAVVGSSLLLRPTEDPASARSGLGTTLGFPTMALVVAVPIAFALSVGGPWVTHDPSAAAESLQIIRTQSRQAAEVGERVLFISQRHLLTFGQVSGVPLDPEYETVFLMEMAMSGNRAYLDRFHALLREHAFGLIVVDRLATSFQGPTHSFGEENDAWVREVSLPILCSYRPTTGFDEPNIELLVPKSEGTSCPE